MWPMKRNGLYAWIVVLLCAFLLIYKYIVQEYPSLIVTEMMHAFQLNAEGVGSIISTTFYAIVVVQLCSGWLIDRYGYRYVSAISLCCAAIGFILFASIDSAAVATIARFMMGAGVGCATVSYVKATSDWFSDDKFAFVNSLRATAAMFGALLGQVPLAYLFNEQGWRFGLLVCAGIGVLIAIIFLCVVREKESKTPTSREIKNVHGFRHYLRHVLTKNNLLLTFYVGVTFAPIDTFASLWGNSFLQASYGLSKITASSVVSFTFIGMALGAPIIGKISDLTGRRLSLMIPCQLIAISAIIMVVYCPMNTTFLSVFLFIYGFCASVFIMAFVVGKALNPLWVIASVAALINTGEPIIGGAFDMLSSWVLDLNWSVGHYAVGGVRAYTISAYHYAFAILPLGMCMGLCVLIYLQKTNASVR